jgi:hypothetical protein
MSYCLRSIIAGGLLAAAAFAWPLAASANPYFAEQTGQSCSSCLHVQYQQPYGQQPSYQQSSRRFDRPMMEGAIVDTCVAWAYDCGQGGANQFCQQQGFRTALNWDRFYPGRTYVIGSQRICEGNNCGGFSYVVCGN